MDHNNVTKEIRNKGEIMVETPINEPVEKVWEMYTNPTHVMQWNHASDDWHSPSAVNNVQVNGVFSFRMEARDGSAGFDFNGVYTEVVENELLAYTMEDGRRARIEFMPMGNSTHLRVTFDPEQENSAELQKSGWQAILENFKKYAEKNAEKI